MKYEETGRDGEATEREATEHMEGRLTLSGYFEAVMADATEGIPGLTITATVEGGPFEVSTPISLTVALNNAHGLRTMLGILLEDQVTYDLIAQIMDRHNEPTQGGDRAH